MGEHVGLTESKIKSWLRPASKKSKSRRNIPNYMPESVMEDLEKAGIDRKEIMNRQSNKSFESRALWRGAQLVVEPVEKPLKRVIFNPFSM